MQEIVDQPLGYESRHSPQQDDAYPRTIPVQPFADVRTPKLPLGESLAVPGAALQRKAQEPLAASLS